MNPLRRQKQALFFIFILVLLILSACNKPATDQVPPPPVNNLPTMAALPTRQVVAPPPPVPSESTPEPTQQTIAHASQPVDPTGEVKEIADYTCRDTAAKKEAPAGDVYNDLTFERPFTKDMEYLPFLDIVKAGIYRADPIWIYVTIYLVKGPDFGKDSQPAYGVEIDNNIDGRGDFLIWATMPQGKTWTTSGVQVWEDIDRDVGATRPIKSDAPTSGNGYDSLLFDQGQGDDPDLAYVRISPDHPTRIDFAFKNSLLGTDQGFLWNPWADAGVKKPEWFDYNDHWTYEEAGSPVKGFEFYYPIKELWGIDNTCRAASGFASTGNEPGICQVYIPPPPPEEPGKTPKPGNPTLPPPVITQPPPGLF